MIVDLSKKDQFRYICSFTQSANNNNYYIDNTNNNCLTKGYINTIALSKTNFLRDNNQNMPISTPINSIVQLIDTVISASFVFFADNLKQW